MHSTLSGCSLVEACVNPAAAKSSGVSEICGHEMEEDVNVARRSSYVVMIYR